MNQIWETSFKIKAFDVDANNRLKVSTIFDYLQDAASNDAERLKFGYKDFIPMGLFWVLSWMKIEIIDYSKFMDEIKIQTWGKKQHKLYSIRDYLMFNSIDEIICKGTSAWILLDSKTLRPKILTQLYPELKMLDSKDALTDLPQKIMAPKEIKNLYSTQIRYSDIDLNQHTNNAKYIEMMLDCFDDEFHNKYKVKSLTVSFNSESKFGDQFQLSKGIINQNCYYTEAKNSVNGKTVLQSVVEWQ